MFFIKHGKELTQSATNKLSQSFNLNVVNGRPITIKQVIKQAFVFCNFFTNYLNINFSKSLLNAIHQILTIHKFDTTNKDSCFKAFICLSLK